MARTAYNVKEWEKFARVRIAERALQRLLASCEPDSCKVRLTHGSIPIFIANKGDKHQQRQVLDKSWQGAFLANLEEHGAFTSSMEDGIQVYTLNKSMIQNIKDGVGSVCVHTVLWPDIPCSIEHSAEADSDEKPAPTGVEQEVLEGRLDILQERKQEIGEKLAVLSEEQKSIEAKIEAGAPEEEDEEETGTVEALKGLYDLCTDISNLLITHGKVHDMTLKAMTRVAGEFEHLHSKVDKLHNENVHLRRENEQNTKSMTEIHSLLATLKDQINPDDTVVGAVKKRLSELEKSAVEHRDLLEAGNKFVKTSMAESAKVMVEAAAKVFIQADHSAVLTKMQSVEELVVDTQVRTDKALVEVYAALENVRAEYARNSKVPIIVEKMTTIATALQNLQTAIQTMPKPKS